MEKLIKPQEQEPIVDSRPRPPRGMLGRIRQASGNFDFSALTGGRRAAGPAAAPDNGPVPYNPIYQPDDDDPIPPLSKVWTQPETPTPQAVVSTVVLEWERAKPPQTAANKPYPSIYEPIDDHEIRSSARSRRSRGRVPYGRATFNRFLLCIWTLLFGVCLGVGAAPVVERYTDYRVLGSAAPTTVVSKPSRPNSRGASSRPSRGAKKATRPRTSRAAVRPAASADPWAPYRGPITVPLAAALALSMLWVFGAPELLRDLATAGYRAAALAVFALALWCGMAALMTTLELRASSAKPSTTAMSAMTTSDLRLA